MSRAQTLASAEAEGTEKASIGLRGAHWTQKPLAAMTERDWRIFREDFDIRVKGGKAPLPLRNWEEGHLADSITQVTRRTV
jgi:ATP-dependent RNA helicase DDX23/PRP28